MLRHALAHLLHAIANRIDVQAHKRATPVTYSNADLSMGAEELARILSSNIGSSGTNTTASD
jgi:hypothetical protein